MIDSDSSEIELVPSRDGRTWTSAPTRRYHPARAWLRECVHPVAPSTYLGPNEYCLIRTHLHWLVPLRAIATATVMMPLAILLALITPDIWWLQTALALTAVGHQLFLFYRFLAWRTEQLIVTDQRIIRTSGVFTTTVDAVNLDQITDTTYHRSLIGHLLNYGTVRFGSAGTTQTLRAIEWVPAPADIYRAAHKGRTP